MKNAFTLIELLIVVLIIAILAAIAVPNFLEFQTRAKVSRAMSDMRALATAFEAYVIDNGRYPPGNNEVRDTANLPAGWTVTDENKYLAAQVIITTPIAYITTALKDPFLTGRRVLRQLTPPLSTDDQHYAYIGNEPDYYTGGPNNQFTQLRANGFRWWLWSVGPSLTNDSPFPGFMMNNQITDNIYDPTNGTVSLGFVIRSNKGVYDGTSKI